MMFKREAIIMLAATVGHIVVPLLITAFVVVAIGDPLSSVLILTAFCLAGFTLFLKSKLAVVRSGAIISFGSSRMSPLLRATYRASYVLIGLGTILGMIIIHGPQLF